MLLSEVLKQTGLTKKAVEYYAAQGLIAPETLENGYRAFSGEDVSRLEKIAMYRRLGVSVSEIRTLLFGEEKQALQEICVRRALRQKQEQAKDALLLRLAAGEEIDDLRAEIDALAAGESIATRLMEAFPGYFGRYIGLHFAYFLGEPIRTDDQRDAYREIVAWLDRLPPLDLPEDLRAFIDEVTREVTLPMMEGLMDDVRRAGEEPEAYLAEHEETIRAYMQFRDTEDYRSSPAARLMEFMKEFQQQNGYNDVFLPAMARLSTAYSAYRERMDKANEKLAQILSASPRASS